MGLKKNMFFYREGAHISQSANSRFNESSLHNSPLGALRYLGVHRTIVRYSGRSKFIQILKKYQKCANECDKGRAKEHRSAPPVNLRVIQPRSMSGLSLNFSVSLSFSPILSASLILSISF